jgi:AcrR family transcriptional regulator
MADTGTKQKLLNAAIRTINEKGEAGVRIEELLLEVNVKAPTLYHHFGNREGLIVEAQAERFIESIRVGVPEIIEAFQKSKTIQDLKNAVRLAVSYRGDQSRIEFRLQRLNALGAAYARPELAVRIVEAHEAMVRQVADAMRPFQTQGLIRSDVDIEMVIAWYNGALIGGLLVELEPSTLDPNRWADVMLDAIDHLLFGHQQ